MKCIRNKIGLFLSLAIFVFMAVWFTRVHPFVLLTGDDWLYIAKPRAALPMAGAWNPTRILPEILMPACGSVAAFVVYPIIRDYVFSFTLVFAITGSFFVSLYIYAFYRYIRCKTQTTDAVAGFVAIAFFLMHFIVMRSSASGNKYLFGDITPTDFYYYTIPTLLNGALVFFLEIIEAGNHSIAERPSCRAGLRLVVLFFAILSNMYSNIVLAVYAGIKLAYIALGKISNRAHETKDLRKPAARYSIMLAAWFASIVIEFLGGRSRAIRGAGKGAQFAKTAKAFLQATMTIKKSFALLAALLMLVIVVLLVTRHKKGTDHVDRNMKWTLLVMLPCGILTAVYMILLSAVVNPSYIRTAKIWIAIMFFFLTAIATCGAYMIKRFPRLSYVLPLTVLILATVIDTPEMTFRDGTHSGLDASVCVAIDNYIIDAIQKADAEGQTELVIDVPINKKANNNWPLPTYMGTRLSYVTYLHRLTSRKIDITFHPSLEANKRFSLNDKLQHQ